MQQPILNYWPFKTSAPRKSQVDLFNWIETLPKDVKYILCEMPVGCHAKGTQILMYDGSLKNVEEVEVGDLLMGPDSSPRTVLNLHRGREMMYRVIPTKGDPFVVNENHILSLKTTPTRKNRNTFTGNDVYNISVKNYLGKPNDFRNNTKLYRSECIEFSNEVSLAIDPYFMGVLLGDGSMKNGVNVTTIDKEIKDETYYQANNFNLGVRIKHKTMTEAKSYHLTTGNIGYRDRNDLINILQNYKLYGTDAGSKFIPHEYKISSKENRLSLLAGLMDTDGHYCKGYFEITSKSEQLASDVMFIARSLGFAAYMVNKTGSINGKVVGQYHRVTISGDISQIPTRLLRKQATDRLQKKRVTVTGFRIEQVEIDEYFGFELNKDHLYLMGDFTVTHNSGKSPSAITLSGWLTNSFGNSFVLTPQRILQKQYEDSFDRHLIGSMYGKANYECVNKKTNCDIGGDIKPVCGTCPAKMAKENALASPNTVLNYTLALLLFKYADPRNMSPRKLMILDECHTLEHHLTEFNAVSIGDLRCKKIGVRFVMPKTMSKALEWIHAEYMKPLIRKVNELVAETDELNDEMAFNPRALTKDEQSKFRSLRELSEHLEGIQLLTEKSYEEISERYVFVEEKKSFKFKELYGKNVFHSLVKPMAEKFLFMSSTILDKNAYCRDLGLNPEEAAFISIPSEFEEENRPVYFIPQMKMNFEWNTDNNIDNRKDFILKIKELCEIHAAESGIIHTGSFQVAEWLVNELTGLVDHEIVHHNPSGNKSRDEVIDAFQQIDKPPSLLISPSITEGLDLKHDMARFAIFAKIPFPFLGDAWVKRRMELSREWYSRQALIGVIQGAGRVVRAPDDWGVTYILDSSFHYLYYQMQSKVPQWWQDGFIRV